MKQLLALFSAALALCVSTAALADNLIGGDADAGKAKAAACAACHGQDGNSMNPEWPKLASQHADYLFEQLKHFKQPQNDAVRFNALMFGQMQALNETDMKNLAAYYAAQTSKPGVADPALVEKGRKIYEGGIAEKNVAACIACHGPAGDGNAAAKFPKIASQHAVYIVNQLKAYKAGERRSDAAQMMRNTAANMTDEEMQAVAQYMQGLQP